MADSGRERRLERLNAYVEPGEIVSDRKYNLTLVGTILYGIIVNIVLCKYVGNIYSIINPVIFLVLYLVLVFAGSIIAHKSKDPAISFLGYNMIVLPVGLVISTLVELYGGISSYVVLQTFFYTGLITAIMFFAAMAFPNVFDKIGGFLFVSLMGILFASIFSIFFTGMIYGVSIFAAVIFSLYIGYDIHRAQMFPKTIDNAVDSAIDIYLDIANLFIRLLQIFGRRD